MRLYLGNLPFSTTRADIAELLEPFGVATNIDVPLNQDTGQGKGIAFADLSDYVAERAITELTGTVFGGRRLLISQAKPKQHTPGQRPWSEHLPARGGRRHAMGRL